MKYEFLGPVYRHFPEEKFAIDFASGSYVRMSTLEDCRKYEDADKGDAGEGSYSYSHTNISSTDPNFSEISNRLDIHVDPNLKGIVTLVGCGAQSKIENAYVLCLTTRILEKDLHEKFGKYVVQIPNIHMFTHMLCVAMSKVVSGFEAFSRPVQYRSREFRDTEIGPEHIGFIKPINPYSRQKEYRIIFHCEDNHVYEPFGLKVPELWKAVNLIKSTD